MPDDEHDAYAWWPRDIDRVAGGGGRGAAADGELAVQLSLPTGTPLHARAPARPLRPARAAHVHAAEVDVLHALVRLSGAADQRVCSRQARAADVRAGARARAAVDRDVARLHNGRAPARGLAAPGGRGGRAGGNRAVLRQLSSSYASSAGVRSRARVRNRWRASTTAQQIIDVVTPAAGESVTEGTILEWHVKVGERSSSTRRSSRSRPTRSTSSCPPRRSGR